MFKFIWPINRLSQFFILLIFTSSSLLIYLSRKPDLSLQLVRDIPSSLDIDRINRNIEAISRWPSWFYSLDHVSIEPPSSLELKQGRNLTLWIDPGKGKRKKFSITAQILEYIPSSLLSISILQDSSGRLNKLFDKVLWQIELHPKVGGGSHIYSTVKAHTCHWRSRFFGRFSEKILLQQIFYPNIIKLSQMRQPFHVEVPIQH